MLIFGAIFPTSSYLALGELYYNVIIVLCIHSKLYKSLEEVLG